MLGCGRDRNSTLCARHFGYCIQPFAYSNASVAIRATAAATPLQYANRGGGCGITGTLLRLFAMDKNYLALRLVPKTTIMSNDVVADLLGDSAQAFGATNKRITDPPIGWGNDPMGLTLGLALPL